MHGLRHDRRPERCRLGITELLFSIGRPTPPPASPDGKETAPSWVPFFIQGPASCRPGGIRLRVQQQTLLCNEFSACGALEGDNPRIKTCNAALGTHLRTCFATVLSVVLHKSMRRCIASPLESTTKAIPRGLSPSSAPGIGLSLHDALARSREQSKTAVFRRNTLGIGPCRNARHGCPGISRPSDPKDTRTHRPDVEILPFDYDVLHIEKIGIPCD